MKRAIVLGLILISFTLLSSVGKVKTIKGKTAFIKHYGESGFKKLKSDMEISKGDIIRTTSKSMVYIEFDDSSELAVYPKSIVKIDKNITDKNNSKSLTLFSGRLWAQVRKRITKKNFFKINTPTATAGVRGTSFGVLVAPNGSSFVKVKRGRVVFDSDIDPRVIEEEKKEENKNKELKDNSNENENAMQPHELRITTSRINREDNSINVDIVTGLKKKMIVLEKNNAASFRLNKGIKPEALISAGQFEIEEKMPENPEKRKEIIAWHISNLEHRVKTAEHLVFKVTNIAAGIESMKSDKRFTVEQISATTGKSKKQMEHIAQEVENLANSMDAQLYFLQNYAKDDPKVQEVLDKHKKFLEEKEKVIK